MKNIDVYDVVSALLKLLVLSFAYALFIVPFGLAIIPIWRLLSELIGLGSVLVNVIIGLMLTGLYIFMTRKNMDLLVHDPWDASIIDLCPLPFFWFLTFLMYELHTMFGGELRPSFFLEFAPVALITYLLYLLIKYMRILILKKKEN